MSDQLSQGCCNSILRFWQPFLPHFWLQLILAGLKTFIVLRNTTVQVIFCYHHVFLPFLLLFLLQESWTFTVITWAVLLTCCVPLATLPDSVISEHTALVTSLTSTTTGISRAGAVSCVTWKWFPSFTLSWSNELPKHVHVFYQLFGPSQHGATAKILFCWWLRNSVQLIFEQMLSQALQSSDPLRDTERSNKKQT